MDAAVNAQMNEWHLHIERVREKNAANASLSGQDCFTFTTCTDWKVPAAVSRQNKCDWSNLQTFSGCLHGTKPKNSGNFP